MAAGCSSTAVVLRLVAWLFPIGGKIGKKIGELRSNELRKDL